jgi:DNA ligase-1
MFKPTLAVAADFTKLKYPLYASPKLDGIRATIVDGRAVSRTLKAIPNKHISAMLSHPALNGLDGELIIGEPTSKFCYQSSVSGVMSHEGAPDFAFYVFDNYLAVGGYRERYAEILKQYGSLPSFINLLPQTVIINETELQVFEAECLEQGYEGLILRSFDAPYKFGRSTVKEGYLLKVKSFDDSEAEIIGFEEEMFNGNEAETNELGRTKRSTAKAGLSGKGTLGAFLVRDHITGVEFAIGTGLTAEQRATAWGERDRLVGKLVKYKFFSVGVIEKPRHPVFLGMRDSIDL